MPSSQSITQPLALSTRDWLLGAAVHKISSSLLISMLAWLMSMMRTSTGYVPSQTKSWPTLVHYQVSAMHPSVSEISEACSTSLLHYRNQTNMTIWRDLGMGLLTCSTPTATYSSVSLHMVRSTLHGA